MRDPVAGIAGGLLILAHAEQAADQDVAGVWLRMAGEPQAKANSATTRAGSVGRRVFMAMALNR